MKWIFPFGPAQFVPFGTLPMDYPETPDAIGSAPTLDAGIRRAEELFKQTEPLATFVTMERNGDSAVISAVRQDGTDALLYIH